MVAHCGDGMAQCSGGAFDTQGSRGSPGALRHPLNEGGVTLHCPWGNVPGLFAALSKTVDSTDAPPWHEKWRGMESD